MTFRVWLVSAAINSPGLVRVELGVLVLVSALAAVAFRCLLDARADPASTRRAASYLLTLGCLYLPYFWLVTAAGPWDATRWFWFAWWPTLPGFLAGLFCHPNDAAMRSVMAAATVLLIALFTWLGSQGRKAMVASGAVALAGSVVQSWIAYAHFLF